MNTRRPAGLMLTERQQGLSVRGAATRRRNDNRVRRSRAAWGILAALTLTFGAAGCAAGPENATDLGAADVQQEAMDVLGEALDSPDGKTERVFGASEDMVLTTVERTFEDENAKAEWSGSTLRVTMDGSIDSPMATLRCTAMEALLTDGESVVIVYDDGEIICADRYNND